MDTSKQAVDARRFFAEKQLDLLRERLVGVEALTIVPQLAIYATGSYGRREASQHSDLDLFFVSRAGGPIGQIKKTLIDAKLIELTSEMGLPEFSGDGAYLQIHDLEAMKALVGSPDDDYENLFTARILLLLESVPLCHSDAYETIVADIVEMYFRDFSSHESDFRPLFLLNDILRFWRTVCLNYEYGRLSGGGDWAKARVKNLKLKFSRAFTCFSTVMHLVREPAGLAPDQILDVVHRAPAERVVLAAETIRRGDQMATAILDEYGWFLELTDRPVEELTNWLSDNDRHSEALVHAERFGDSLYELVSALAESSSLSRYLVI